MDTARHCKNKLESIMNIDDETKKVWKRKHVQEKQVQDQQEAQKDKKVPAVMLSGFVASCEESSQDDSLGESLFWTIQLVDSLKFVEGDSVQQYMAQVYDWQEGSLNKMAVSLHI